MKLGIAKEIDTVAKQTLFNQISVIAHFDFME